MVLIGRLALLHVTVTLVLTMDLITKLLVTLCFGDGSTLKETLSLSLCLRGSTLCRCTELGTSKEVLSDNRSHLKEASIESTLRCESTSGLSYLLRNSTVLGLETTNEIATSSEHISHVSGTVG